MTAAETECLKNAKCQMQVLCLTSDCPFGIDYAHEILLRVPYIYLYFFGGAWGVLTSTLPPTTLST